MKNFITIGLLACISINLLAQSAPDGHENHFKNPDPIETDQYKIEFNDVLAENQFCKLKVTITNKTQDYLLVDLDEVVFTFEHGEYKPGGKLLIIDPIKSKSKVLEVNGNNQFHVEEFQISFNSISSLPLKGEPLKVPDYRLPPESENFTSGPISCSIGKLKKESRTTATSFSCQYQGDKFLVTNPLSIMAKLEDGKTFPNVAKVGGGLGAALSGSPVLQKGDKDKIPVEFRISTKIIDMQFATFWIVWNSTFMEASPTKLAAGSARFVLDPGKTAAQNK